MHTKSRLELIKICMYLNCDMFNTTYKTAGLTVVWLQDLSESEVK